RRRGSIVARGSRLGTRSQGVGQLRRLCKRVAEAVEIAGAERDGAAPDGPVGRVGDADEPVASGGLEQLHERAEPAVARLLGQRDAYDERRLAERGRDLRGAWGLRHATNVASKPQRVGYVSVTKV